MKIFALVDCNNFYASCERVFNPFLKKKPIVVLSNNDGCVIARSNEAKELGIQMGEPFFKIKNFLYKNKVNVFSSNYTLYGDLSRRVMNILHAHVDSVEEYSIDEAFLQFDKFNNINDIISVCEYLRITIYNWVGIPVSIGIAPTKVLAKIANHIAKKEIKNNIFALCDKNITNNILSNFLIKDIWGIGAQYNKKLINYGVKTAYELSCAPQKIMRKNFSVVMERIILELNGISCINLEKSKNKKEIVSSRSFGKYTNNLNDLKEAVSLYAAIACKKLRKQNSLATKITVFITSNFFNNDNPYYNFASFKFLQPTQNTIDVTKECLHLLIKIFKPNILYKKVGVILSGITNKDELKNNLICFNEPQNKNNTHLMQTIDKINDKYGKNTLFLASQGIKQPWKMKRNFCSKNYTTNWQEILQVK